MNRVVNCTVLSNFAAVGRLDLLRDTIGPLYLPTEVYDEVLAGQMAGYTFYDGIEQHIQPFTPDGWLRLVTMTDDRAAREQARAWNLLLSGTLGVLLLAVQDGRLTVDEGNILLGVMIQRANYRSPVTDLSLLLDRR